MTPERWQKIEAIVQSALDVEARDERERFVAEACAGDEELRREVERLMSAADDADSFIELPVWTGGGLLDSVAKKNIRDSLGEETETGGDSRNGKDDFRGRKIGVFELKKELGRGGMGAVYLAERADGEFRQKAAVKLIKRGMDTDFIVKRFRHERQILAALSHPNIAGLIDGGTTADGLPYFVMEYVEGKPLYRFCDERKLNTTERLRLFRRLCDAVEAAHKLKVVHRDLKPSNILVKADGTPKLLDFGIAKILDADLASATLEPTATAMRMMTPEYASPEQVCGEPVSPASDIYSLGVLLYELLTGHRPYRFKNRALHEIHRAVCEEMPSVPSESLTSEDNLVPTGESEKTTSEDESSSRENSTLEVIFRARNTDFENLRRELSGDLDKIVLKTLRKNAGDRYQTASELAADIDRFLDKRPVKAETFDDAREKSKTSAVVAGPETTAPDLAGKQSAAILPFKILGAANTKDTDGEEFLGIGLADALVTRLSVIRQIVVRPTSSVLAFGETADPFRAGKELAVDFVVDGNIRRVGERIRVSVQLLSVGEHATLWAQSFDEQFTDVLSLEDSISGRVAGSLVPQLTGEENERLKKRGTNSAAAHEAYLRGRYFWNQFTPESLFKALESFQKALAIDADYALAHVGVADFYIWANIYGLIPSAYAQNESELHSRRAIEIDEHLGEAHATFGLVVMNRFQWAESEKIKLHAINLNPGYVHTHEFWGAQLIGTGRAEEGLQEMRLAEKLEPFSVRIKTLGAWALYQARRFDEALEKAGEIIEMDKNHPQGHSQAGFALWALGRREEALRYFQKFDSMMPEAALAKYELCFGLAGVDRHDEAWAVLDEMKTLAAAGHVKPYFLAMAHVALGETDNAFEYFEQALAEHEPWMLWFGTDPMLESLHGDARFVDLLERMNNPIVERFKK